MTDPAADPQPPRPDAPPTPVHVDPVAQAQATQQLAAEQLAEMTSKAGMMTAAVGQVQQELANLRRDYTEAQEAWENERADLLTRIADLEGPQVIEPEPEPPDLPVAGLLDDDEPAVAAADLPATHPRRRENVADETAAAATEAALPD